MIQAEQITDTREGKPQLLSNIDAWKEVAEYLASTLGPYGSDKMFVSKDNILITNDGATILKRKNFEHPSVRILASISFNQDKTIGDGTTSVVLLASEFLQKLKSLIKDDFPIKEIIDTLHNIKEMCLNKLNDLKLEYNENFLYKVAETALNSKILKYHKEHFGKMVVNGIKEIEDLSLLGIKKVPGGNIKESELVEGIAFEKCFTYAGYEQQPKKLINPKIACLNIELEWKAEKENAELKINSVEEYDHFVNAEWKLINDKLDEIISSGAKVVLSKLPIGDYATQYFAKHGIFCSGRVDDLDLKRVSVFANAPITSNSSYLTVGECDLFEEIQVGKTRFNFLKSSSKKATTIILRGPCNTVLDELERSLNDSIMVVKNVLKNKEVLCGGGSVEMQLSSMIRKAGNDCRSKAFLVYTCIAQAFEIIPFILAQNFGIDAIATIQLLRKKHHFDEYTFGVDNEKMISDMRSKCVFEPVEVKRNIIRAAFSAVIAILEVDMTILTRNQVE
ncbi:T complex 1 subunit eta [Tubulinosema ratisbonensis]|uniref:CCT-eta n=1 Tax=Tubulinosema ratisbonensis TaxID=291195 RepID=A0A437AM70_9MICR|nr:T complex 1 subunit eta [Tubulinosema ratisbonensis]